MRHAVADVGLERCHDVVDHRPGTGGADDRQWVGSNVITQFEVITSLRSVM